MKSFAEIINENYTDSELDRFRHTKLKPKRLKALISDYSEFEHIDLEAW